MSPRQIVAVVAVVLVAFGASFLLAGASGGDEQAATPAVKRPEPIEVESATVSASVSQAAGLPALNVPRKRSPKPVASSGGGTVPAPSTPDSTPRASTPSVTSPPPPTTTTPRPQPQPQPQPEEPIIVGGGND